MKEKQRHELGEEMFSKIVLEEIEINYNAYFSTGDLNVYVFKKENKNMNERKKA